MKRLVLGLLSFFLLSGAIFVLINVDYAKISYIPNHVAVSKSDISQINNEMIFGKMIRVNLSDVAVSSDQKTKAKMWIKLFGIIPIKKIDVEIAKGEEVYIGGIPLGFAITSDGLIVVGDNSVASQDESKPTNKTAEIKHGDVITKINGNPVVTSEQISQHLNETSGNVNLTIVRDGDEFNCEIEPLTDKSTGETKIGLWVKNNTNGIGTLTYIKMQNGRFGALGHAILDYETGIKIPVYSGKIYKCNQVGIEKAETNKPGELKCVFLQGINAKGTIDKNTEFGVFGSVNSNSDLTDNNLTAEVGSRLVVKPGKAKIVSSVSGVREEYDIEIIKASYQPTSDDKSLIFRVTDKRLLSLTGGILQGMSGSPILQNGKLIGAVTHVFVSDPTKGYGIYADWMIEE